MRVDLDFPFQARRPHQTIASPLTDAPADGPQAPAQQLMQLVFAVIAPLLLQMLMPSSPDGQPTQDPFASPLDEAPKDKTTPPSGPPTEAPTPGAPSRPRTGGHSVADAERNTDVQFKPVLRGDEKEKDAKIQSQDDFNRAVDEVAADYGLDPNLFRAQLQAESGAMTNYKQALNAEGDVDRRGENNSSIGVGQISRKFLDGREWSGGGPGNPRVGGQTVTTEDYLNSPTIQLRMAASNLAQRIEDHGGVERGLSYYVNGSPDSSNPKAASYLENINRFMNDPAITETGRA